MRPATIDRFREAAAEPNGWVKAWAAAGVGGEADRLRHRARRARQRAEIMAEREPVRAALLACAEAYEDAAIVLEEREAELRA